MLIQFPKVNASWLISGTIQDPDKSVAYRETPEKKESENLALSIESKGETIRRVMENMGNQDTKIESTPELSEVQEQKMEKKIVKIITFYDDFSFDEYRTNSK
jgi:hypothetical protein